MRKFKLKKYYTQKELASFAEDMLTIQDEIGFKVSSRGWCYILEGRRLINKDQFNKVEELINNCRRNGHLPIDFVAEEKAREFNGVEIPHDCSVVGLFGRFIRGSLNCYEHFTPDWWDGEEYYIQMVVEKVDLVTLFQPVCEIYHIPIANSKGWSSMLQRAQYARRFSEAEERGLKCVLLYCGDHDPDGLRISEFIRKNLEDLSGITWEDGTAGYDPSDLIIQRFGLNRDFIERYDLTWIDNLITGSGRNLADPRHKNFNLEYLQRYLRTVGERKVEANAIVTQPEAARRLVQEAIEQFLGPDARDRFLSKSELVRQEFENFMQENRLTTTFTKILNKINNYES